jgi:hypothetical protein
MLLLAHLLTRSELSEDAIISLVTIGSEGETPIGEKNSGEGS